MKTVNNDEISLAVANFARDNTSARQLKHTLKSISKPEWLCIYIVLFTTTRFFDLFSILPFQLSISTPFPFENCFRAEFEEAHGLR